MTREHLYFIPIVLSLGVILGSQITRHVWTAAAGLPKPVRRVSSRGLLIPLFGFVLMFVATHAMSTHGGAKAVADSLGGLALFDQHASFSAGEVALRIDGFGEAGRRAYQRMTYTSDLVFPLVLFTFLIQLARFVVERAIPTRWRAAAYAFPALWLLSDLAENSVIYHLLGQHPTPHPTLAAGLGWLTSLKFGLLLASVATPAVMSVRTAPARSTSR